MMTLHKVVKVHVTSKLNLSNVLLKTTLYDHLLT